MLSSASARKRSQLITITTLKNGCDSSILPAGFSAPTRIKGAMNGAKYQHIIGDSLIRSAKHLRAVQQLIFCSNNDLKYTVQWDQYWNGCRTKVRKNLTYILAEKLWYHVTLAVHKHLSEGDQMKTHLKQLIVSFLLQFNLTLFKIFEVQVFFSFFHLNILPWYIIIFTLLPILKPNCVSVSYLWKYRVHIE